MVMTKIFVPLLLLLMLFTEASGKNRKLRKHSSQMEAQRQADRQADRQERVQEMARMEARLVASETTETTIEQTTTATSSTETAQPEAAATTMLWVLLPVVFVAALAWWVQVNWEQVSYWWAIVLHIFKYYGFGK